ncbi:MULTISPECIES: DEAD/DEAH box helicase [unclassified Roseibium]|uniref:DEAD/DEAH box helicase n=1 Tax=unclassified Roseibium TaxID=2629323 RepID=UPI00273D9809|nr:MULTISPECIES: DEAD/DEAH box helicase [unclassified Roseibium]
MDNDVLSLSADFRELSASTTAGRELSSRVVQPELRLSKASEGFKAALIGTRMVRGEKRQWEALSLGHNWVLDGNIIRPLPHDTPVVLRTMLGRDISDLIEFPEVIHLLRLPNPDIPVCADKSVFQPAQSAATEFTASPDVPGLKAQLFPYQAQGVAWMLQTIRHTGGLILADEMGLGKTIQIIALLLCEKPEPDQPALIICPTSLIANWRNEILKFAPEISVLIHRGPKRSGIVSGLQRAQVVLSTYETVVNDQSLFEGMTWSWLICDEAQALKNPDSGRRKAIARIPRIRAIPMTGTPVETSLLDLWSLSDIAIPGLLGNRTAFEGDFPNTEASARELAHLTDPIVLCRKVRDVADDLPERINIDIPLELGDELSMRYEEILRETVEKYPVAGNLVATGQLQLFCAHPWLQGSGGFDENEDAEIGSLGKVPLVTPKVERAIAILDEAFRNKKKVLLFAIFNNCGAIVQEAAEGRLPEAFWGAINGSTPQQDRQDIVDRFTRHDGPGCLVLNPKAAGAGLNITAATIVIHFTQAWNPALEAQASARAHRRGQNEPVYVYRLYYEDTVERVMIDRSEWRRQLGNEAVPISTRDSDDLQRALSIQPIRSNV